jgi:hypothetical protein
MRVVAAPSAPRLPRRANHRLSVQPRLQKYSGSLFTQITCITLAIPAHTKGRFAIVTNVGCGMRWTQGAPKTRALTLRTAKPCGPDAPTLASSW